MNEVVVSLTISEVASSTEMAESQDSQLLIDALKAELGVTPMTSQLGRDAPTLARARVSSPCSLHQPKSSDERLRGRAAACDEEIPRGGNNCRRSHNLSSWQPRSVDALRHGQRANVAGTGRVLTDNVSFTWTFSRN